MKKLYLDDIRTPKTKGWDIVRSYDEFVKWIEENGLPDKVSFDHDLGEAGTKTGYDAAKWLVHYCYSNGLPFLPEYNVHSANPVGKANIESYLSNAKKHLNKL
jgi:hypothetical protein